MTPKEWRWCLASQNVPTAGVGILRKEKWGKDEIGGANVPINVNFWLDCIRGTETAAYKRRRRKRVHNKAAEEAPVVVEEASTAAEDDPFEAEEAPATEDKADEDVFEFEVFWSLFPFCIDNLAAKYEAFSPYAGRKRFFVVKLGRKSIAF